MSLPREVVEAAQAIRQFEKNDNPDSLKNFELDATSNKVHIDHEGLVNSLVKFVSFVNMPVISKEIMLSKLTRPGLTNMQIALTRGMREYEVDMYEQEGKARVAQALESATLQDAVNKYNRDETVQNAVKNLEATTEGGQKFLN